MVYKKKNGFTLIELLVTIAILAVLTLIVLPAITRTQSSAGVKKFSTYEQVLLNGAKLYVDSNKEDLWGRNENGCLKISYSKLKLTNLIKDFNGKDIDCSNDTESFVFVTKSGDKYNYKSSLVCRKGTKIVYSNKAEESNCTNAPDKQPPVINANPDTSDWIISSKLEEQLKVEIKDESKLMANASFKYKWVSDINDTSSDGYLRVSITNYKTNTTNEISTKVKVPNTINGTYYLKIIPISICDISNKCQSHVYVSGAYKISNKPKLPTISNPTDGNWTNNNITLTVRTTTPESQIGYWYYSYDDINFVRYDNSSYNSYGKSTFDTSPYSTERNQLAYIRVCNRGATSANDPINCSDSASTMIRIDKTKPTISYALINDRTGARHYSGSWSKNGLYRYLYPADNASGINTTQYNSGGDWNTENNLEKWWMDERDQWISYRTRDNAGNYSDELRLHIMIDWTPPIIIIHEFSTLKNASDRNCAGHSTANGNLSCDINFWDVSEFRYKTSRSYIDNLSGVNPSTDEYQVYSNCSYADCGGNECKNWFLPNPGYKDNYAACGGTYWAVCQWNCNWIGWYTQKERVKDYAGNMSNEIILNFFK